MPDIPLRIQKSQVHFYENQEVETGVFKDILQLGLECVGEQYKDLPTYGIRVEVDPGTPITCAMIKTALDNKIAEVKAQMSRDSTAREQLGNCPGVTEDADWFYFTVTV